MKSTIFTNAWKIQRVTKVSFSDALKSAWKAFKNNIDVRQSIHNARVFVKGICTTQPIEKLTFAGVNGRVICESLDLAIERALNYDNQAKRMEIGLGQMIASCKTLGL